MTNFYIVVYTFPHLNLKFMLRFVRILETFKPMEFCYFKLVQEFYSNWVIKIHIIINIPIYFGPLFSIITRNYRISRNLQFKQLPPTGSDIRATGLMQVASKTSPLSQTTPYQTSSCHMDRKLEVSNFIPGICLVQSFYFTSEKIEDSRS